MDNIKLASSSYVEQITSCLDYEGSGCVGATLYVLSLPFKIIFAFVPPPRVCGGWACFIVALAFIGGLTALIGDPAGQKATAGLSCDVASPMSAAGGSRGSGRFPTRPGTRDTAFSSSRFLQAIWRRTRAAASACCPR